LTWACFTRVLNWPTRAKKPQFTHERVEYNVFLFDEPFKGSNSLKIFKISLTSRFDQWWHLSKSVHKFSWSHDIILSVRIVGERVCSVLVGAFQSWDFLFARDNFYSDVYPNLIHVAWCIIPKMIKFFFWGR
jgi:hypothetical protein